MGNICGGTVVVVHERDTETTNAMHEEALETKQQQIDSLLQQLLSLQTTSKEQEEKIIELETSIVEIDTKNISLLTENEQLKVQLNNLQLESQEKNNLLEQKIKELEEKNKKLPSFPNVRPPSAHHTPRQLKKVCTAEVGFDDVYTPKSTTEFNESDLYDDPIAGGIDGFLDDVAISLDAASGSNKHRWSNGTTNSAYVGFDNVYNARNSLTYRESDLHYDAVGGIASPYDDSHHDSNNNNNSGYSPVINRSNDENNHTNVEKKVKKSMKKKDSAEVAFDEVYDKRGSSNTFGFAQKR